MRVEMRASPVGTQPQACFLFYSTLNVTEIFKGINLKFIFTNRWSVYIIKLQIYGGLVKVMIPFIAMLVSLLLFRTLGFAGWEYMNDWVISLRFAVAVLFLLTASAHWGKRRPDLIAMIPPGIPKAALMVTITGLLELAGAMLILIPATTAWASAGLALMLIAMFPANVYAANHHLSLGGKPVTPIVPRTFLQIVFLAAVLMAGWLPPQG